MGRGRWIAQSAERTARTVGSLVEGWGANAIEFYDNNFFVHEGRSAEFADRIRHFGIGWWAEGRVDSLLGYSDQTWALLQTSGLRMVFMGAESGSDDTLRRMQKGGTTEAAKTLELVDRMGRLGISTGIVIRAREPTGPSG